MQKGLSQGDSLRPLLFVLKMVRKKKFQAQIGCSELTPLKMQSLRYKSQVMILNNKEINREMNEEKLEVIADEFLESIITN